MKKQSKNINNSLTNKIRKTSKGESSNWESENFNELSKQCINFMIFLNCHEIVHKIISEK